MIDCEHFKSDKDALVFALTCGDIQGKTRNRLLDLTEECYYELDKLIQWYNNINCILLKGEHVDGEELAIKNLDDLFKNVLGAFEDFELVAFTSTQKHNSKRTESE